MAETTAHAPAQPAGGTERVVVALGPVDPDVVVPVLGEGVRFVADPRPDDLTVAVGAIARADAVVDRDFLARAPALRVIARTGVGVDLIDLAAATALGIAVVITPGSGTRAMLAGVRPRDPVGRTLRRLAADQLADLVRVDAALKAVTAELKQAVTGSQLMDLPGIGPAACRSRYTRHESMTPRSGMIVYLGLTPMRQSRSLLSIPAGVEPSIWR